MIQQKQFSLPPFSRGFHLITDQVLRQSPPLPEQGLFHLSILHTSAALAINENADPSVLADFEQVFNHLVPEGLPFLTHTQEGPDDMPAHIKAALLGSFLTLPVRESKLLLGVWQGIYLCEFRNAARPRQLVVTVYH